MEGVAGSIFLGLQNRRAVSESAFVHRLGDDPESFSLCGSCSADRSAAIDQGGIVSLAILFVEVAPIAGDVPGKELTWRLTGILKGFKGTRRGDDPAEAKLLGLIGTHFVSPDLD